MDYTALARDLLRASPEYLADARTGVAVSNTVVGSVLSLVHSIPRQYAEQAVARALIEIDGEAPPRPAQGREYRIPRTGESPLKFRGEKVVMCDSHDTDGPRQNRWHAITLYRTDGGIWIAHVQFFSRWQGEEDTSTGFVCPSDAALCESLSWKYDPCAEWTGHPSGAKDAEQKNRVMAQAIMTGYRQIVSDVLAAVNIEEVVE